MACPWDRPPAGTVSSVDAVIAHPENRVHDLPAGITQGVVVQFGLGSAAYSDVLFEAKNIGAFFFYSPTERGIADRSQAAVFEIGRNLLDGQIMFLEGSSRLIEAVLHFQCFEARLAAFHGGCTPIDERRK